MSYTVGVEAYDWPAYSDSLLNALQSTHLFKEVRPLKDFDTPPTFIARVEEPYYGGTATIPIFTILTLGIIPTVVPESFGYDFSLTATDGSGASCHVRDTFKSTTTLGWLAMFKAMSPDVSLLPPDRSDRAYGRLAIAILDQLPAPGPRKE
ncbi:MAG TPA: hypothetical protein VK968_05645 [Roseimicrobium sp.]|nr:hypothetical protein [Roseimicrobium sp.]